MYDLIVLGYLSHDIIIDPQRRKFESLGGTAAYASIIASNLNAKVGIVSIVGKDFKKEYMEILENSGIDLKGLKIKGEKTTSFMNCYDINGKRTQYLLSKAKNINLEDIPKEYFNAKCFHFGPLFNEIPYEIAEILKEKKKITSIDPQGYCRRKISENKIEQCAWKDAKKVLRFFNIYRSDDIEANLVVNEKDPIEAAKKIKDFGPEIVIVTMERKGSILYYEDKIVKIPAIPVRKIIDATGAGDTYMASFLIEYIKNKDPIKSALFASCAASLKIETIGLSNLPKRELIEERLKVASPKVEFISK
ncbi:MAG: carbohydrate kinase family protein [Nitrososphaerota archaeon]